MTEETDLDAPLLNEHTVTLNGDSINLHDLLIGRSDGLEENDHEQEGEESSTDNSKTDPSSSLSLDDNRSNNVSTNSAENSTSMWWTLLYNEAKHKMLNLLARNRRRENAHNFSGINYGENSTRHISQKSSLSSSKSTSILLKLIIPFSIIINHIMFYQAQTAPMWNLAYSTNVTITATANTLKSKAAFDTLNLPHDYTFTHKESNIIQTFTYMDAIRKLWDGDGLGDAQTLSKVAAALLVVFSGFWPHLKLFLLHCCWFFPFNHRLQLRRTVSSNERYGHTKTDRTCCKPRDAVARNSSFCCANGRFHDTYNHRSPFLRALSTLGKWSLADVLVVCILIAVLHLDWKVNPYEIRAGVENELPTLLQYIKGKYPDVNGNCEQLLGYPCEIGKALVIHYPQCIACKTLMSNAYNHPEWATSEGKDIMEGIVLGGGGFAQLRVMGMVGTYFFCASVITSILLSLIVDLLDEKDRKDVEDSLMDRKSELEFILPGEEGYDLQLSENEMGSSVPIQRPWSEFYQEQNSSISSHRPHIPSPTTNSHLLKYVIMCLLSIISLPFVCYAVTLPSMQRLVYGGGPRLLHEVVGMKWEQEYSLITLVKTTGEAGGWDTFLMLTFGVFVVLGPIVRAFLLTLHACLGIPVALLRDCIERPRHRTTVRTMLYHASYKTQKELRPPIDFLGAFCSWEVLAVALIMIQLEMPSITSTIKQDDRCQEADPEHGRTCIEVEFNALDTFLLVIVSFIILTVASGLAMSLASSEKEEPLLTHSDEKRYEYGQPIPIRHNLTQNSERYLPLQQQVRNNEDGLEQIVFI